jgi:tryptophan synthase alpha chain
MNESKKAPVTVMAHLVAGYPTDDLAFAAARGLAEGGVSYFEVQLPFSDPSADGKSIQTACASVLSRGYRVEDGFAFVSRLRREFPDIPVFVMTYGNLAYRRGITDFVARAAAAGAAGLIVPDLPFDADEGLDAACRARGLVSVPVAAPSMTDARVAALGALARPYVYAALRAGITGAATAIDGATLAFIKRISAGAARAGGEGARTRVLGGFGIRTGEQSRALKDAVHAVVAGSAFVDAIGESAPKGEAAVHSAVLAKARELTGFI